MPFLGLGWSSSASSVLVDEKRLSFSRAASTRPGVVPGRRLRYLLGHLAASIPAVPLVRFLSFFLEPFGS